MKTLGILGGGQLARMLVLAGAPLDVRFQILDPAADACAGLVAPLLQGGWGELDKLDAFAQAVDVATYDFENIPATTAEWVATRTISAPNAHALAIAQDRIAEKKLFRECGLPTTEFAPVTTRSELDAALHSVGVPAILKTRREGYDGKGQYRIRTVAQANAAWSTLGDQAEHVGLVLERFVPFDCEISVIAVRGRDGDFRTWPTPRNWHVDGVLSASLVSALIEPALGQVASAHARAIAEKLDYVGTLAVEMFVKDGKLLGNEMAPRVHNSGHWTIEGAVTSQFENHVRAVMGMPLGDTSARGHSCMLNWLGMLPERDAAIAIPGVHWHDYGKSPRAGRKVGHATVCADDIATLAGRLARLGEALDCMARVTPVINALHAKATH